MTFLRAIMVVVLGGVGGALCDQIHVRWQVLTYPEAFFLGQPWWVAPVFGAGALLILVGAAPFARRAADRAAPNAAAFLSGTAWFLGAYFATGLIGVDHPWLLAGLLFGAWIVRVAPYADRWIALPFGLLLAAGGCAWEGWWSSTGAFAYAQPVWHVPIWLPGLYLHGAPLALAVARANPLALGRATR